MIITVRTTDTFFVKELQNLYPSKYDFIKSSSRPIEFVSINNLDPVINIHLDIGPATINDGKLLEARSRKIYSIEEFFSLHGIAETDNTMVEIEFMQGEVIKNLKF